MVELPDLSDTCKIHWNTMVECLRAGTSAGSPVFAVLEQDALEDELEIEPVVDANGNLKEAPSCPQDSFYFRVASDFARFLSPVYMGYMNRIYDKTSRHAYSSEKLSELKHQVGLRLINLLDLAETKEGMLFFTSTLLGYSNKKVTRDFIENLLNSKNKTLKYINERILD